MVFFIKITPLRHSIAEIKTLEKRGKVYDTEAFCDIVI